MPNKPAKRVVKSLGVKGQLAAGALAIFQRVLTDPQVRQVLLDVPADVIAWAKNHGPAMKQLNPAQRFGQVGLQRRVTALSGAIHTAFPKANEAGRGELLDAVERLQRALAVAGKLPLIKRKVVHRRLDNELDSMEHMLVDAVLPAPAKEGSA